jgi:radical SAM superfamily enzyme YgiQ (UPF0313 family)
MARAGCQAICFGVESGSQELLDLAKKRSDLAKVREAMRMTQAAGISALASFIIGLPGETESTLRQTVEFAESLRDEFGSLYGFHILAPFPGTEVRERAAELGLEILTDDWTKYDANHVVTRTPGADPDSIRAVSDAYEATIEKYVAYQDHLYAAGKLEGYELKTYRRRRRQELLWRLLLDEVVESLPPFAAAAHAAAEPLKTAIGEATGAKQALVDEEVDRLLALGALVPRPVPEGTSFAWAG